MKNLYILVITLLLSGEIFSQVVDGAFLTNIAPPVYEVSIGAKMQSGSGSAGVVSIEFSYNTNDLSFPLIPVAGTHYILQGDFNSYFPKNITRPAEDRIRISLVTTGSPSPVPLTTSYTNVITFYFDIINLEGESDLTWIQTEIAPAFLQPNYTIGVWNNLNETPLPVELSSFTAAVTPESNVKLNWETKTEVNNYGFDVERRLPGNEEWSKLGFVEGYVNSNSPKTYSFLDKYLTGGSKFEYRLKQIDTDGKFDYTSTVEVEIIPVRFDLTQNFPNPFNPVTKINFSVPKETELRIVIYNMLGESLRVVAQGKYEPGFYQAELTGIDLPSGVYIYRLESKEYVSAKKMILLK